MRVRLKVHLRPLVDSALENVVELGEQLLVEVALRHGEEVDNERWQSGWEKFAECRQMVITLPSGDGDASEVAEFLVLFRHHLQPGFVVFQVHLNIWSG